MFIKQTNPVHSSTSNETGRILLSPNTMAVLQCVVDRSREVSRADIARSTGLTRATVSSLVVDLMERGLVCEWGIGDSDGGKPPTLLAVDERTSPVLAVAMEAHRVRAAVMSLEAVLGPVTELEHDGGQNALESVREVVARTMESVDGPLPKIGVGTPGVVDDRGRVVEAVNLDWHNVPISDDLEQCFGVPVSVVNDSQAAALIEHAIRGGGDQSLVSIRIADGIGAGVVLGGELYRGTRFRAGEVGHFTVNPEGPECRCGRRGCLERIASVPATARTLEGGGDIADAGRSLARVITEMCAVLDVPTAVLCSPEQSVIAPYVSSIRSHLSEFTLPGIEEVTVEGARVPADDSLLIGAGSFGIQKTLGVLWRGYRDRALQTAG